MEAHGFSHGSCKGRLSALRAALIQRLFGNYTIKPRVLLVQPITGSYRGRAIPK